MSLGTYYDVTDPISTCLCEIWIGNSESAYWNALELKKRHVMPSEVTDLG